MKEKISVVVDKELWTDFKAYCKENGMSFSKKVEVLIRNELDHKTRKEKRQTEIMEILADLIHEKKGTKTPSPKAHSKLVKKASAKGTVSDLQGLTERFLEKRGRLPPRE
ncbi:MAG: hypothetical protein KKG59_03080 [Nanoarchaeota archaeon]|nr:hypothetical protein [Nanoarchaeota archaeon]